MSLSNDSVPQEQHNSMQEQSADEVPPPPDSSQSTEQPAPTQQEHPNPEPQENRHRQGDFLRIPQIATSTSLAYLVVNCVIPGWRGTIP